MHIIHVIIINSASKWHWSTSWVKLSCQKVTWKRLFSWNNSCRLNVWIWTQIHLSTFNFQLPTIKQPNTERGLNWQRIFLSSYERNINYFRAGSSLREAPSHFLQKVLWQPPTKGDIIFEGKPFAFRQLLSAEQGRHAGGNQHSWQRWSPTWRTARGSNPIDKLWRIPCQKCALLSTVNKPSCSKNCGLTHVLNL